MGEYALRPLLNVAASGAGAARGESTISPLLLASLAIAAQTMHHPALAPNVNEACLQQLKTRAPAPHLSRTASSQTLLLQNDSVDDGGNVTSATNSSENASSPLPLPRATLPLPWPALPPCYSCQVPDAPPISPTRHASAACTESALLAREALRARSVMLAQNLRHAPTDGTSSDGGGVHNTAFASAAEFGSVLLLVLRSTQLRLL